MTTEWYDWKKVKPKDKSRVLYSIGGYTQSQVLICIDGVLFSDSCEVRKPIEKELLDRLPLLWTYLPLSDKDIF